MDEIKKWLQPVTDQFPQGVRDFLDGGGLWLVLAVAALLVLLLLWLIVRGLARALFGRHGRATPGWDHEAPIDLSQMPLPQGSPGPRRLTVYHVPVRPRLVVLAA